MKMTKSYSEDNLFTTFNNIEKIKKSKQERKLKTVIRVEEMIKTIKEHYNLNSSMLANNLGVDAQTVYKWEKGDNKPNMKRYNKIKELYEEITKESKEETLEQPETALKPLEIANKEVTEDVAAGTPFIATTGVQGGEIYLNINKIQEIHYLKENTSIFFGDEDYTHVEETPEEIFELIRKKTKENEKN